MYVFIQLLGGQPCARQKRREKRPSEQRLWGAVECSRGQCYEKLYDSCCGEERGIGSQEASAPTPHNVGKSFTLNLPPLARRKIRTVTVTCRSGDAAEVKLVYVCKSALKTATVAQMLLFTEEMSLTH